MNKLDKPYSNYEYANFAVACNFKGQRIERDGTAIYALYPYEILQDGQIVDISQTPEYIAEQELKEKERNNLKVLQQIAELESQQNRPLRELLTSPNDFARNKLIEINNQIQMLRLQLR